MQIDIITVLPDLLQGPFSDSIVKRAIGKELVTINIHNLRDYAPDKHKSVDDYAYGGGAGMVMMVEPIYRCITSLKEKTVYDEVIYMCPDGELLDQPAVNQLSTLNNLIMLCGHYKGIDERIRENLITREISIGSYVISGGELAAAILTDAIVRLLPGVLSDETSALTDSFQDGLLAPPAYTRPAEFMGWKVPDILLSGNDKKISEWRFEESVKRTQTRRPDLLK
ncbi:MAG: tRNA (guanosine(37)-N1)-methyltransferase TrmD [Cyclobacteriaceae bacterium]|nr:tRNA (guanosine(37)-N1)-methyltransferase TrmD [Cyclobacteriaceae bacterium]